MSNVFDFNPTSINPFPYWKWNKVLPAVYDDSLSQYEILCKLLNVVNIIIESTNSTGEQVEQLTQLVQQLIDGKFPSGIVQYVTDIANAAIADDIEALSARITALQNEIDSFDESVSARITALNNQVDSLDQSIQSQINTISTKLNNINKRNFVLIGDSYLMGIHANSAVDNGYGWGHYFSNVIPHGTINEYANGGSGFWSEGTVAPFSGMDYYEMLQYLQSHVSESDRAEVDCVVIQGGYNDGQKLSTVGVSDATTRFDNALSLAHTIYPNAQIVVAFTDCGPVPIPASHCKAYWLYQNRSLWHGAHFIGCVNSTFAYSTHSYDNIHPKAAAQLSIGTLIASAVNGNGQDYQVGSNDSSIFITPEHDIGIHIEYAFTSEQVSAGLPVLISSQKICSWNQKYMPCFVYTGANPWPLVTIRLDTNGELKVMNMQGATLSTTGKIYGNGNVSLLSWH